MSHAFINSKGEYILEVAEEVYFDATPVAELERERIIKLLEAMREKHIPWCGATDCIECEQTIGIEKAIALIKGEQK